MDMTYEDYIFTREDGTQVLVTVWSNGESTMAERSGTLSTWGPQTQGYKL